MNMKKRLTIIGIILCAFLMTTSIFAAPKSETDFIRKLIEKNYFDLAEELCDKISQDSNASEQDKNLLPLLRSEIMSKKAETETDFAIQKELMKTALEQMIKYEASNPSVDTKTKIALLLSRMARSTAEAKKNETAIDKLAELSKDSEKLFNEAVEKLRGVVDELSKSPEQEKVKDDLIYCNFMLARTLYEYAVNSPNDKRDPILDKAIKLITEEIEFLYMASIYGYESAVIGGLCYKEKAVLKQDSAEKQKNYEEAGKQFDIVIVDLKKVFDEQNINLDDYTIELMSRAYFFKAQMLTQTKQNNPKAIATVDEMMKLSPKVRKMPLGFAAQLEKGTALTQAKNFVQAMTVYDKIIELDGSGPYAEEARKRRMNLSSVDTGDNFDQKLTNIDWLMQRNKFYDAIAELRKMVITLLPRKTPDHDKYLPIVYNRLGECYQSMSGFYEASFFFENVFTYFPNDKLAPKAAFQAVRCLSSEFFFSDNPSDQKKYEEYLKIIVEKYPTDPVAGNSKYIYAEQLERQGKLKEAMDLYQSVPENAEAYDGALIQAASCSYRLGMKAWIAKPPKKEEAKANLTQAETILKKAIKRLTDPNAIKSTIPEEIAYRDKLRFSAFDQISSIYLHESINKPQELMQMILEAEKSAKEQSEINKINILKIRAYISTDKLEEAESLFRQLPDMPEIVDLCHLIAASFDASGAKLDKDKKDPKKATAYYLTAGQYYLKWLDFSPLFSFEEIQAVSDRLYITGVKSNELPESIDAFLTIPNKVVDNLDFFKRASFYYTRILSGEYGKINEKDKFKLLLKLARCYGFLRIWPEAKKVYEEAIAYEKLLDENGRIKTAITQANPGILSVYQELGFVYRELAQTGARHNYDSAYTVFANILNATQKDSKAWWINKYYVFQVLFERGNEGDIQAIDVGISNLQRNYPDFDGGKYGVKDKFLNLQKEVKDKLTK